jgi:hypothetical protein
MSRVKGIRGARPKEWWEARSPTSFNPKVFNLSLEIGYMNICLYLTVVNNRFILEYGFAGTGRCTRPSAGFESVLPAK